jgi:hypothetical protein
VECLRTGPLVSIPALPGLLGWQPSRFLADRAEAERAYALAEQLGSVNAAAAELGTTWPSLGKAFTRHGLGMPARNPEAIRQRAIAAAHKRRRQPGLGDLRRVDRSNRLSDQRASRSERRRAEEPTAPARYQQPQGMRWRPMLTDPTGPIRPTAGSGSTPAPLGLSPLSAILGVLS